MHRCTSPLKDAIKWAITSTNTRNTYEIWVFAPQSTGLIDRPVLYLLDGQWDFALLHAVYGVLKYDGFIDDLVIVGISYQGNEKDIQYQRTLDFSAKQVEGSDRAGQAAQFIEFLRMELMPEVEREYSVGKSNRILAGASLGATFALHCLFTQPNLFGKYILASPMLAYADQYIPKLEAIYHQSNSQLPVKLYFSVGDQETSGILDSFAEFKSTLISRQYKNFDFMPVVINGERHAGLKPETFNRGLRYVMSPDFVDLPPSALNTLAGKYHIKEFGVNFDIFIEDGQLRYNISAINLETDDLLPVSEEYFLSRRTPLRMKFSQCPETAVIECALTYNDFSGRAVKS